MYGTPWNSDGQSSEPGGAPLSDLFVIRHGSTNQARRLDPNEALAQLIAQVYLPYGDKQGLTFTFEFLEDLVQSVPCYQLGFAPDERVVDFVQRLVSSRS
jgi:hypothetical protein